MWSEDNRTAGFRLCGEGTKGIRMECRIGGADLNPYLAFAALIAAGLAGIDEKLELQKPFVGDAYQASRLPEIPKTLRDATETLAKSKMLKQALGDDVSNTMSTPPAGSSSNTTAGSRIGNYTGGSSGTKVAANVGVPPASPRKEWGEDAPALQCSPPPRHYTGKSAGRRRQAI